MARHIRIARTDFCFLADRFGRGNRYARRQGAAFCLRPRTDSFGLDNFYGKRFRMAGGQLVADPSGAVR